MNKVIDIAMENKIELEGYEEEVAEKVLGCGSDEVSIMSVVYPPVSVNVSSLGSSLSVGFYYKNYNSSLTPLTLSMKLTRVFQEEYIEEAKNNQDE